MIKKNNKGFTLLELLISIFILTTVIFIGYRVINKSTIDIKNQSNINKGQLTINDMNEYLTKDLEQASSVIVSSNYMITQSNTREVQNYKLDNKKLEDELLKYIRDESSIGKVFDYTYQIRSKDDENKGVYSISYNIELNKYKNNYKYSVSRKETSGTLISFINNEVLNKECLKGQEENEVKLPFKIGLNDPYEVSFGYSGKNNEFVRHKFTVTYRLNDIGIDNSLEEDDPEGSEDGGNSNHGDSNNYLWYCLEMSKKSFEEAYESISDENIKNDLINIINPIINISKTNPLDEDKYNEISEKIKVLNDNIENLLGSSEGCLSSEDKYIVFEILKKGKNYLDVAIETIKVSPDSILPDPPNSNIWNDNVSKLGDTIKSEINSIKSKVSNVKASLNNNTKYTLQYKSLAYMEEVEYPKLDQYFQNQIYAIIKDKILDQNVNINSESKREEYNKNLYASIDNINRMIESIIHVQFELEKIIKVLDNDVEYQKNELIESVNELTIVNKELVRIKGHLEQASYKDEKIEIYEDIFGEHTH